MTQADRKEPVLKALPAFALALVAFLLAPALAQARPGDLDHSFGDGGKVRTGFCGGYASPYSVATDSRGRIVVGGQNSWSEAFCLDRFRLNGSHDPSFGSGGEVRTDFGAAAGVRAVAIDSQGRIVASGFGRQSGGDRDFAIARYRVDGSLDPSFGNDGTVTTDLGGGNVATSVAIDSQGRIVVLGDDVMLVRYDSDGNLDPSFGTGGRVTMDFGPRGGASSVAIDSRDRIAAAGSSCVSHSGCEFALARYNPNGRPDDSFSGDGKLTTRFGRTAGAGSVAIDSHDRIVASGDGQRHHRYAFALARYTRSGSLDASFSGNGKTTTAFKDPANAGSVAIDSRGRIVAAGYAWELARYRRNGRLDRSFSGNGKATTGWGSYSGSAAIDPRDRIVEAGAHGYLVLGRFIGYRRR
jgi:uncharacterized delta-60 repeat protein